MNIEQTSKNIFTYIRIQAYDSTKCGYFSILFIDCMLAGESLIDFTNFFSLYDFKKNDKIVLYYFI